MKFQYINEIIPLLEIFVQKYGGKVIPCTIEEVNQLESILPNSYRLPGAFKEFLLYGGKELGKLFEGEHSPSYYQSSGRAKSSRAIVASLIYGSGLRTAKIPEDVFVVSSHITSYVSGGVLTGGINFFDNPSRLRIKELEKDLIKQKVVKQNLEKEITKLEKNSK